MHWREALILSCLLALGPGAALAQGLACTCTPTATLINFGPYDVLSGAPLDSAGSFSVTCRLDRGRAPVTVSYNASLASTPARQLAPAAGTDRLSYNLYVDAARTQPWGDGTGGSFTIGGTLALPVGASATDGPRNYYGRIAPGGQDVSAGAGQLPAPYGQVLTIAVTCTVL